MLARLHKHNHPLLLNGTARHAYRWPINVTDTKDDHMYKTIIAGITAISLSVAAPAQANGISENDIGKILLGLFATAAAASIINNAQDNEVAAPAPAPVPRPDPPRGWYPPRDTHNVNALPRACLQNIDTRFGNYRMFVRNCMRDNYRFTRNLPEVCTVRVASRHGPRNGWDEQCLREQGYTTTRR